MDHQQNPCIALAWAPEGTRSRGGSRETWGRTTEREAEVGMKLLPLREIGRSEETSQWSCSPRGVKGQMMIIPESDMSSSSLCVTA